MDKRINEINAPLMLVFPDCAALASSAPVSVAEMQTLIEPAEALARGAIRPGARLLSTPANVAGKLTTRTFAELKPDPGHRSRQSVPYLRARADREGRQRMRIPACGRHSWSSARAQQQGN